MNKVAFVIMARLSSRRVPRKMLIEVGGIRLIDRGCRQLVRIVQQTSTPGYVACWGGDVELLHAVGDAGLPRISMTEEQSRSDDWSIYSKAFEATGADRIVIISACSCPFVRDSVYIAAGQFAATMDRPFVLCQQQQSAAWVKSVDEFEPLLVPSKPMSTKYAPTWCKPTFIATGVCREDLGRNDRLIDFYPWVPDFSLHPMELLDSDTREEIELLKLVASGGRWERVRDAIS